MLLQTLKPLNPKPQMNPAGFLVQDAASVARRELSGARAVVFRLFWGPPTSGRETLLHPAREGGKEGRREGGKEGRREGVEG